MASLAELGEISKAQQQQGQRRSGREAALVGSGMLGAGTAIGGYGAYRGVKEGAKLAPLMEMGEENLTPAQLKSAEQSMKKVVRHAKIGGAGGALGLLGAGGLATGAVLGAHNIARNKYDRRKRR